MPSLNTAINAMEMKVGTLGSLPRGVPTWVELMKTIARKDPDRDSAWWTFLSYEGLIQAETELDTQLGGEDDGSVSRDITSMIIYGLLGASLEDTEPVVFTVVVGVAAGGSTTTSGAATDWNEDATTDPQPYLAFWCEDGDGTIPTYTAVAYPEGQFMTTEHATNDEIMAGVSDTQGADVGAGFCDLYIFGKVVRHD